MQNSENTYSKDSAESILAYFITNSQDKYGHRSVDSMRKTYLCRGLICQLVINEMTDKEKTATDNLIGLGIDPNTNNILKWKISQDFITNETTKHAKLCSCGKDNMVHFKDDMLPEELRKRAAEICMHVLRLEELFMNETEISEFQEVQSFVNAHLKHTEIVGGCSTYWGFKEKKVKKNYVIDLVNFTVRKLFAPQNFKKDAPIVVATDRASQIDGFGQYAIAANSILELSHLIKHLDCESVEFHVLYKNKVVDIPNKINSLICPNFWQEYVGNQIAELNALKAFDSELKKLTKKVKNENTKTKGIRTV